MIQKYCTFFFPINHSVLYSPTNNIFLQTFNSEYGEIKVWFTDQSSKPLNIEDRINLTLVIKWK